MLMLLRFVLAAALAAAALILSTIGAT